MGAKCFRDNYFRGKLSKIFKFASRKKVKESADESNDESIDESINEPQNIEKNNDTVTTDISIEKINEFISSVQSLDLIVFKSTRGMSKYIIKGQKLKTNSSAISHVEIAIDSDWYPAKESTMNEEFAMNKKPSSDPYPIMLTWGSTSKKGVSINPLAETIYEYLKDPLANVGICKLLNNPINRIYDESKHDYLFRSAILREKISDAYTLYNAKKYNSNPIALLGALFPSLRPLRDASVDVLSTFTDINQWLFCSEFVAAFYIHIGVITDETDGILDGKTLEPKDVIPVDFIGADTDLDGIVKPICEIPPRWFRN